MEPFAARSFCGRDSGKFGWVLAQAPIRLAVRPRAGETLAVYVAIQNVWDERLSLPFSVS